MTTSFWSLCGRHWLEPARQALADAGTVWSEGPLWVAGDLTADVAFCCCDNDYGAHIGGDLVAPSLLHLDRHLIQAGSIRAEHRFTDRADVPADLAARIAHALRQPSL